MTRKFVSASSRLQCGAACRIIAAVFCACVSASVAADEKPVVVGFGPGLPIKAPKPRESWHVPLGRPEMLDAWQRLAVLKIPGVPLDQRFDIRGETYYVSPDGDDEADGSAEHPWRTLAFAVKQLRPNTVVWLRGGTYYGPVVIRLDATPEAPAALRGVEGEEVMVTYADEFIAAEQARLGPDIRDGRHRAFDKDGQHIHYPPLISVLGKYVEVSGLHLVGVRDRLPHNLYSESGIQFHNHPGTGCRVLYCEIENVGHCGVKGGEDCLFEGNFVHDLGQTFHDHGFYQGGANITFRKNLVVNCTGWGIHGYTAPQRLVVSQNVLAGNDQHGMVLGGHDCVVAHNVFSQNNRGGLFLFRNACRDNAVKNNVFVEPRGTAIAYDHDPTGNLIDFNCFAPGTKPGESKAGNVHGLGNFAAEPGFLSPATGDFRIGPKSPLVDRGDKVFDSFAGMAPDVGLFEVGVQQPVVPR